MTNLINPEGANGQHHHYHQMSLSNATVYKSMDGRLTGEDTTEPGPFQEMNHQTECILILAGRGRLAALRTPKHLIQILNMAKFKSFETFSNSAGISVFANRC